MEKVVLKATKRDVVGKKVGALRRQGKLPAVLYGHHIEATAIMLDAHEGSQTLSRLTSSSLVTIDLDGKKYLALVKEKQRDFIRNRLLHLDFLVVSLTEKMRTKVSVRPVGEPAGGDDGHEEAKHRRQRQLAEPPERRAVARGDLVVAGRGDQQNDSVRQQACEDGGRRKPAKTIGLLFGRRFDQERVQWDNALSYLLRSRPHSSRQESALALPQSETFSLQPTTYFAANRLAASGQLTRCHHASIHSARLFWCLR